VKGNLEVSTVLYIYPGREHCALNWGDVGKRTLLSEAGMTGGEHCASGAGMIVATK